MCTVARNVLGMNRRKANIHWRICMCSFHLEDWQVWYRGPKEQQKNSTKKKREWDYKSSYVIVSQHPIFSRWQHHGNTPMTTFNLCMCMCVLVFLFLLLFAIIIKVYHFILYCHLFFFPLWLYFFFRRKNNNNTLSNGMVFFVWAELLNALHGSTRCVHTALSGVLDTVHAVYIKLLLPIIFQTK